MSDEIEKKLQEARDAKLAKAASEGNTTLAPNPNSKNEKGSMEGGSDSAGDTGCCNTAEAGTPSAGGVPGGPAVGGEDNKDKDGVTLATVGADVDFKIFKLDPAVATPKKAYDDNDAGFDLFSRQTIKLAPAQTHVFKLGFMAAFTPGYEAQIRARGGMAADGIIVPNGPGTIESSYRGEWMVLLHNVSRSAVTISKGQKIAQVVFNKLPSVGITLAESEDELGTTKRGASALGGSGK